MKFKLKFILGILSASLIGSLFFVDGKNANPVKADTMDEYIQEYQEKEQAPLVEGALPYENTYRYQKCNEDYTDGSRLFYSSYNTGTYSLANVRYSVYGDTFSPEIIKVGKVAPGVIPVTFYVDLFPDHYSLSGDYKNISWDTQQQVLGYTNPQVGNGQMFVVKKKGKMDFSYNSSSGKYESNIGSYYYQKLSERGYVQAGQAINTGTYQEAIPFEVSGEDIKSGVNIVFLIMREVCYEKTDFLWWSHTEYCRQLQVIHFYVANDVPVAGYHAGKYTSSTFSVTNNISPKYYQTSYSSIPSNLPAKENCISYKYKSDLSYGGFFSNSVNISGQLKNGTYNNENAYIYKGSTNPVLSASYIDFTYSNSSSDSLTPVTLNSSIVDGKNIGLRIGTGAYLLEKSTDNKKTWEAVDWQCNVCINGNEKNTKPFTFELDKSDFINGVHYRLTAEFLMYKYKSWTTGILWWKTTHESKDYYAVIQTIDICIVDYSKIPVSTESTLSHGYGTESSDVELKDEESVPLHEEFFTLGDEAVSFSNITIDNLGTTCNRIYYRYNEGSSNEVTFQGNNSQIFDAEGRYDFTVVTPFGSKTS